MKLLVEELGRTLSIIKQKITVGDRDIVIKAIRPHLYKHLNPTGNLILYIYDAAGSTLLATSETLSMTTIHTTGFSSANYGHGDVRFYINAVLLKNTSYQVWLGSSGGYTYSASAFYGWCNDWDLAKVNKDYTPASDFQSAFLMEFWEYRRVEKGMVF